MTPLDRSLHQALQLISLRIEAAAVSYAKYQKSDLHHIRGITPRCVTSSNNSTVTAKMAEW